MFAWHGDVKETGDVTMPMGRPKAKLVLKEDERSQLASIARSILAAPVARVRVVLAAADSEPNSAIAQCLQLPRAAVTKWCLRFLEQHINGLYDKVHLGKPCAIAALNVLNGAVLATCEPRQKHQEFLSFPREIDKAVATGLDVHWIVDNYGSHKHPKIKTRLAARPAGTCISFPPRVRGLTRSNASSR